VIRIKVDEDLPVEIATLLRDAGCDVRTVAEQDLRGASDERLWGATRDERRCLVTADKGFAAVAAQSPGSHAGLVLLRHPRESRRGYVDLVRSLIGAVDLARLAGAIVIVSPDGVRIRRPR